METTEISAQIRTETKKGPARRLRQQGLVPAIFYGRSAENIMIAVANSELTRLRKEKKEHAFIKLIIDDGGRKIEKLSVIKEMQRQPLTGKFYHADFYEVEMTHTLTADVTLNIVGKSVGVELGGELQQIKRDVKVSCLPNVMPEHIDVDITHLDIGHSVKVKDLVVPDGVTLLDPPDAAIISVVAIKAAKDEAEGKEEPAEAAKEPEAAKKE